MWTSVAAVLLLSTGLSAAIDLVDPWDLFKIMFKKNYKSDADESQKKSIWQTNVEDVMKNNMLADMGQESYFKEINKFSDMTMDEIKKSLLGAVLPENRTYNYMPDNPKISERAYPSRYDWRDNGYITSVKDQGGCGSCWAFAVTGAVEGFNAIVNDKHVDLSQQQLVDCGSETGTGGCAGGWPDDAFKYIKKHGLDSASCYPYKGKDNKCMFDSNCVEAKISNYYDVPKEEAKLQEYLYYYGPVSVVLLVDDDFMDYKRGVYSCKKCKTAEDSGLHAVLLVGYGTENGLDYWVIKNSWGTGWGDSGYIKVARGIDCCEITQYASIPWM